MSDRVELLVPDAATNSGPAEFEQLLAQPAEPRPARIDGARIGALIGFRDPYEPLVTYAGQPGTAALIARTSVELYADHIGDEVTLVFEDGDPHKPIVTGRIRVASNWPAAERPTQVEVDADGQRLTVTAKDRLVFRCGKASITLTHAGKVIIEGAYVVSQSTGVNRVKGGSVQLN